MIHKRRRIEIYYSAYEFFLRSKVNFLPFPIETICKSLGLELVKLSDIRAATGQTLGQIFNIWGNKAGRFEWCPELQKGKIAYNEKENPGRIRFTLAHELAHYILKHHDKPEFNIFNPSGFNQALYDICEEEANIWAGIVLCPPVVFYELPALLNEVDIRNFCDVSKECAEIRVSVLKKYKKELQTNLFYPILQNHFSNYMNSIPCPICGYLPIESSGLCRSCMPDIVGNEY